MLLLIALCAVYTPALAGRLPHKNTSWETENTGGGGYVRFYFTAYRGRGVMHIGIDKERKCIGIRHIQCMHLIWVVIIYIYWKGGGRGVYDETH